MTPKQALEWLISELGPDEAEAALARCIKHLDSLDAIIVTRFDASDPRRQKFRQAVRILIEEAKGLK